MSLTITIGIVAVVNLAIGYALALLVEGEHGVVGVSEDGRTIPAPATPAEAPVEATATQPEPPSSVAEPTPANFPPSVSCATGAGSAGLPLEEALAKPVAPLKTPAEQAALNGDPTEKVAVEQPPSVDKTIVNCERWLDAADVLLQEERELRPASDASSSPAAGEQAAASESPLKPRATLADASQLEAAITGWWQNDPHRTRPISVGQIEIDNFRHLTAELGIAVAGNLAQQIEARVLNALRRDDLVASLGRARFLVLFFNSDGAASAEWLDQLRSRLEATDFIHGEQTIRTTLTGGIAQATADESLESFLARAADALAEARAKGRNRVAWHNGATAVFIEPHSAERVERVAI